MRATSPQQEVLESCLFSAYTFQYHVASQRDQPRISDDAKKKKLDETGMPQKISHILKFQPISSATNKEKGYQLVNNPEHEMVQLVNE